MTYIFELYRNLGMAKELEKIYTAIAGDDVVVDKDVVEAAQRASEKVAQAEAAAGREATAAAEPWEPVERRRTYPRSVPRSLGPRWAAALSRSVPSTRRR